MSRKKEDGGDDGPGPEDQQTPISHMPHSPLCTERFSCSVPHHYNWVGDAPCRETGWSAYKEIKTKVSTSMTFDL